MLARLALASLVFCSLTACRGPEPEPPGEPVARDITLTAAGLFDNPNPLSQVPDGAFSRADDVVIRRPGFVETRRGFAPLPGTVGLASTERIDAFSDFAGTLVAHATGGTIARYTGTAWVPYTGNFQAPAGRKMRFLQLAGSLYFTTSKGVYRLDGATEQIVPAGVPQALAGSVATTGSSGFLPDNSAAAYRVLWGYRNANERVILGAPSGRMVVRNGSSLMAGTSKNVTVTVPVPSWVTADHFLQVYRSDYTASSDLVPGDDVGLVFERYPTASERTAGTLTLTDVSVDEQKGAFLYSSPNAGFPGSEKFQPPVCRDLEEHKDRAWGFCTTQRQRMNLSLLSVDAVSGGMRDGDTILFEVVGGAGAQEFYRAASSETTDLSLSVYSFQRFTDGTPAQNIARTANSLVRMINKRPSGFLRAQYTSDEFTTPGSFLVEARELGDPAFRLSGFSGSGSYWSPAFQSRFYGSPSRASGVVTVTDSSTQLAHGFAVGQVVNLAFASSQIDINNFPLGLKTVTAVINAYTFQYTEAGADVTSPRQMGFITQVDPLRSDSSEMQNGLFYGEFAEGADAAPLANYLPIGSANYAGLRAKRLGSSLLLFKEDGTFVLNGDSPETFNVDKHPSTAKLVAPDTVQSLGTSVFALTDQGVMAYSDAAAKVVSGPIEGPIKDLIAGDPALAATVKNVSFSVSYESEREYWLFLPTVASDVVATQAYIFNATTGAWTHWTTAAASGYVLPGQDKAYLGSPTSNTALMERKSRTASDYQDADGVPIQAVVDWAVRTGDDPTGYKTWQKAAVNYEQPKPGQVSFIQSPDTVTMGCQTEIAPVRISGPFTRDGLPYTSTYIPEECARSQQLTFGVSGGQVGRRLSISGLSVDYFVSSSKVR